MERIGRYNVVRRLAEGGMADVFLAVDDAASEVAIKRIRPVLTHDRQYVSMFLDEARLLAQLEHPNVVRVFEVGQHQGLPFLVMELLDGVSVARLQRGASRANRPLSIAEVIQIGIGAADGLHYAHTRTDPARQPLGIVHRDITPRNLFVTRDGAIKVLDFGIARMEDRSVRTRTGVVKGTVQYMSPEQCRAQPTDARSDVFSLCIVLWELLAAMPLYLGESDLDVMLAITESDAPRLSTMCPRAPQLLEDVLARGLVREPSRRFASARDVRRALEHAAHELQLVVPTRELAERVRQHDPVFDHEDGGPGVESDLTTRSRARGAEEPRPAGIAPPGPGVTGPTTRPLPEGQPPMATPAGRRVRTRGRWVVAVSALAAIAIVIVAAARVAWHPSRTPATESVTSVPSKTPGVPSAAPASNELSAPNESRAPSMPVPAPSESAAASSEPPGARSMAASAPPLPASATPRFTTATRTKTAPPTKRVTSKRRRPQAHSAPKWDSNAALPPR